MTTVTSRPDVAAVPGLRGAALQLDSLAMPAYAWVLALLFGICCGLALLAAVVSVFRCMRRRDYSRLGADRLSGGLIPAYMQYVYGSGPGPSESGSGQGPGQGSGSGLDSPSSLDSNSEYTFVGVSIPLLQDVTRI